MSAPKVSKVQNPLPASVVSKHPCDSALTDAQLTELLGMVPSARREDDPTGPVCGWQKTSTGATIGVGYLTNVSGGLSQVNDRQQGDAYYEALEVGGYPALAYNSTETAPVSDCHVAVGITDTVAYDVGFVVGGNRAGKQDPCDVAKIVAQDVLENLKAAAR
ncbi:hypothetical protein Atai01_09140 [Amycolatopsis taiwanensis]|uniref:DUF3558 domain-containing protein n=1 Tax=Amycolatopsis taiwanensis TaxID=342230 RepID=A0A9W6VD06_9PSEU|nr:hypothetical protein Atai01_09140 [Amycolatopsis taiwanensis]